MKTTSAEFLYTCLINTPQYKYRIVIFNEIAYRSRFLPCAIDKAEALGINQLWALKLRSRSAMVSFNWYNFSELTNQQLYAILALRSDVFVVEQACAYPDIDGKDQNTLHLLGVEDDSLITYLRLFPPSDAKHPIVYGRVVTAQSARSKGYAKQLMQVLLSYCDIHFPGIEIKCSAQHYLTRFYEGFGFKTYGRVYEEDGIPHIEMRRKPDCTFCDNER